VDRVRPRGRFHYQKLLYFHDSWSHGATTPAKQKTYGRFSGTIFFEGSNLAEDFDRQQLANAKSLAKMKKRKKSFFLMARIPCFPAKTPKKGGLLAVSTYL
jgi:hypothetical protein